MALVTMVGALAAAAPASAQTAVTSPAMGAISDVPDLDQTPPPLESEPLPPPPPPEQPVDTGFPQTPLPALIFSDLAAEPAPQPAPPRRTTQLAALPGGSGVLDSATVQRMVDRLVALHFLASVADGENPDTLVQAIKDFQQSAGISPTGTLDRDTIGRLTTP